MRLTLLIAMGCLLLPLLAGCNRGEAAPPGQPPLLDRAIAAAGGEAALAKVRSFEVRSHGEQKGAPYRTSIQRVLPDCFRDDVEVGDVTLTHATDGKEVWEALDDFPIEVSPEEAGSLRGSWRLNQASMLLPLKTMADVEVREDGKDARGEVLRVTFRGDSRFPATPEGPYWLAFDATTLLLRQVDFEAMIFGMNKPGHARFEYADYRRVEGIMAPFHEKMFVNDKAEQEDHVDDLVVNPTIAPDRFRRPAPPKECEVRARTSPELLVAMVEQVGPKPEAAADAEAVLKRYLDRHGLTRNGPAFRIQPLAEGDLPAVGVPVAALPPETRPTSRPTTRDLPRITVLPARRILTTMIPAADPAARDAALERLLSRARAEGSEADGPCRLVMWSAAAIQLQLPVRPRKG